MRTTRLITLAVAAVATTSLLAACGGDDDGGGDEGDITEVIETSVVSTDPENCTKLQTQQFLEQNNFEVGEAAVTSCEESAADTSDDPDSVEVSEVSVDGESATADVAFTGGAFDGSTISVDLVKEGDQWKLDRITDIPELNLASVQESLTEQVTSDPSIPPEIATCFEETVSAATEEDITAVIVGGTTDDLEEFFGPCFQ